MVPPLFHRLLRDHQTPIKLIFSLSKPKETQLLIPSLAPLLLSDPQIIPSNPPNPNLYRFQTCDAISPKPLPIFPSFPFGYYLNPVYSSGSSPDFAAAGEVVSGEDVGMMWADSVKKKRKRKMNKHKLKKLRKRLRRKT